MRISKNPRPNPAIHSKVIPAPALCGGSGRGFEPESPKRRDIVWLEELGTGGKGFGRLDGFRERAPRDVTTEGLGLVGFGGTGGPWVFSRGFRLRGVFSGRLRFDIVWLVWKCRGSWRGLRLQVGVYGLRWFWTSLEGDARVLGSMEGWIMPRCQVSIHKYPIDVLVVLHLQTYNPNW